MTKKTKRPRYQVFEKLPNGKSKIHNIRLKKDAVKKQAELKAAGTSDGDLWDTLDNDFSKMFKF